ncbi:MAG: hypothetical protein ACOCY3_01865 [Desulfosalsimonas sp.]
MDTLIFLLVLIIIIISNIARIQKKQKETAAQQGRPQKQEEAGWKMKLRDRFEEMQSEIQGSSGQARRSPAPEGRSSGWSDILSDRDSPEQETQTSDAPAESRQEPPRKSASGERRRTLIESRSRGGRTPEARIGKTERPIPAPPVAGLAGKFSRQTRNLQISRKELRRAIIWYEVLGPPMSLRDPEREMWL